MLNSDLVFCCELWQLGVTSRRFQSTSSSKERLECHPKCDLYIHVCTYLDKNIFVSRSSQHCILIVNCNKWWEGEMHSGWGRLLDDDVLCEQGSTYNLACVCSYWWVAVFQLGSFSALQSSLISSSSSSSLSSSFVHFPSIQFYTIVVFASGRRHIFSIL